jgi:hypothetical protein
MPDPKAPVAPAAKAPVAPAAAPAVLTIDERFAALAAELMSQIDAKLETFRQEIATQLGLNVDPLHKDLHDLLDMHSQLGARVDKIEALQPAPAARLDELQKLVEELPEKIAPKIQPVITVSDQSLEDRVKRLEGKLKNF